MATTCVQDLVGRPFPEGYLAYLLVNQLPVLRTICFEDNEKGDAAHAQDWIARRVIPACNSIAHRGGHLFRIASIDISSARHHHIIVKALVGLEEKVYGLDLYPPSRKVLAAERKAEEEGSQIEKAAPRRGVAAKKKKKKRKTKAVALPPATPPEHLPQKIEQPATVQEPLEPKIPDVSRPLRAKKKPKSPPRRLVRRPAHRSRAKPRPPTTVKLRLPGRIWFPLNRVLAALA
jgi:hypothetical protein